MRSLVMSAVAVLAAAAAAPAQEKVDNPAFQNWSKFKPGTAVVLKRIVKASGQDDPNSIDVTARPPAESEEWVTLRLLEATPEKAVVERTVTEMEAGNHVEHAASKITYPAKIAKSHVTSAHPKDKVEGFREVDEFVSVGGKEVKTQLVESVIKIGEELSVDKLWTADTVPGGIVKQFTLKKQGGKLMYEAVTVLTEVKLP